MPRLFVAIDLPPTVTAKLARLQPQPAAGLRLVKAEQMHLTLHFIGEAEVLPIANALQAFKAPAFSLEFEELGQFRSGSGTVTLWAGVKMNDELLGLHAGIAAALANAGLRLAVRRYKPHISLARCKPAAAARAVPAFLAQQPAISLPRVPVTGFGLYSSMLSDEGAVYRREQWFPLQR
ncbi:RNA 2',3'-cyclic phosphodiesterase [Undibacterium sp.]|jgi:2'-5' RNA ligase|uniref:RNA 2',3'-cyclic phosphodiesterase n=1 Tax=Undibacterium sp. TaxID=1914977 RepID=UPI002C309BA2|nr:RNA 2',3'-cyclic phosphodiesterase [Undibacterium sp.]HTD05096.1 RNA 2',3'-cyclic phosphodiesterase [Undibacterium sp.]